jgi:transcriptional regulator with XRE-family HTH domain
MVSAAIRKAREDTGMTRQALADATGLKLETVREIESLRTPIDFHYAYLIAKALGTTIGTLSAQVDTELLTPAALVNYAPDGTLTGVTHVPESAEHRAGMAAHVIAELSDGSQTRTPTTQPPTESS